MRLRIDIFAKVDRKGKKEMRTQITLRAARISRGFTSKEVAVRCNRNVDTILKYEKDSTNIPRDLMVKLLELYGFGFDDIFFGTQSDFIGSIRKPIA